MNKTVRKAMAAIAAGAVLFMAVPAYAHNESIAANDRQPTIVLHVINYADLAGAVLEDAKARVAIVYELIGVRILWIDSNETVVQSQDGRLHVTMLLLSRDMARRKSRPSMLKTESSPRRTCQAGARTSSATA